MAHYAQIEKMRISLQRLVENGNKGSVHGTVHILDWGPDKGLPALVLAEQDPLIMGYLFSTEKLEQNWQMLDEFEGFQYERVVAEVVLESGEKIDAWTYVMKPQELK
jgi:gamma-glutamylcyclotransferase (GGCT)/AIG2-like uncharacterized protein YtfP